MKIQHTITAHPRTDEQLRAIRAFMEALKIQFEESKTEKGPYKPEFIAKIQKSRQDYKNGKGTTVTIDELNRIWK